MLLARQLPTKNNRHEIFGTILNGSGNAGLSRSDEAGNPASTVLLHFHWRKAGFHSRPML
jgi:hypothetical protein